MRCLLKIKSFVEIIRSLVGDHAGKQRCRVSATICKFGGDKMDNAEDFLFELLKLPGTISTD
jgi:hypothetical protein